MILDPWAAPPKTPEDPHGLRDLIHPNGVTRCVAHDVDVYGIDGRCSKCVDAGTVDAYVSEVAS